MHFQGKVLIEIEGDFATPHWLDQVPKLPSFDIRKVESEDPVEFVIQNWIEEYGRLWVNEFSGGKNAVNCPDGTLTPGDADPSTPTTATPDMWYCKNTGISALFRPEYRLTIKKRSWLAATLSVLKMN